MTTTQNPTTAEALYDAYAAAYREYLTAADAQKAAHEAFIAAVEAHPSTVDIVALLAGTIEAPERHPAVAAADEALTAAEARFQAAAENLGATKKAWEATR